MREKLLIPSTIVPSALYVERKADRQVREIVRQAGRPGYILVSRQMGKTNLLIHARNELTNDQNTFVYIDLSANFSTAQECFRHIIDTAISSHSSLFGPLKESILKRRKVDSLPPYKEHEQELTSLLESIPGKLVIILDEIDSLKRAAFSDQIFAQIRTMYFARVNFPIFGRLTYLLSGVAEPKDLIKNKDMSPFNIGQKIYLDDFSLDEFDVFLEKAKLTLSPSTKERIFYWTQGNPRITWDVCSFIEDKIIAGGEEITPQLVDQAINSLYLSRFDIPPVDHIRTLVEEDEGLQNALVEIKYLKGDALSDSTKSKLYLAGIIGSNDSGHVARIKNPVISAALSDSWLKSIRKKTQSVFQLAQEKFSKKEYEGAISLFEQSLLETSLSETESTTAHLMLAHCHFEMAAYAKALSSFQKALMDREGFAEAYYDNIYYQGLCLFRLGNNSLAIERFTEVTTGPLKNNNYYAAKVNLAGVLSASYKDSGTLEKIIELNRSAIEEIQLGHKSKPIPPELNNLLTNAAFNLGRIFKKNQPERSAEYFQIATQHSTEKQKPAILVELVSLSGTNVEAGLQLKALTSMIVNNNLMPEREPTSNVDFSLDVLNRIFSQAFRVDRNGVFSELLEYIVRHIRRMNKPDYSILTNLSEHFFETKQADVGTAIIIDVVDKHRAFVDDRVALLHLYRLCTLYATTDNYVRTYLGMLEPSDVQEFDLAILYNNLNHSINGLRFDFAREILSYIKNLAVPENTFNQLFCIFLVSEMQLLAAEGKDSEAQEKARAAIREITNILPEFKDGLFIKIGFLTNWRSQASSYLARFQSRTIPLKRSKKYGRNELVRVKYTDGTIEQKKYKKVQQDIESGLCEIVEERASSFPNG